MLKNNHYSSKVESHKDLNDMMDTKAKCGNTEEE